MEAAIRKGIDSLSHIVEEFLYKDIELLRVCRTAVLLKECGVNPFNPVFDNLAHKCAIRQRKDGGWTDVEETLWCTALLYFYDEHSHSVVKAIKWLKKQENSDGCWGKSNRDQARIPLTALILYFLPQLKSDDRLSWLEKKMEQEKSMVPNLTYKVTLPIMAFFKNAYQPENKQLMSNAINWLCEQQNGDGGWGPWKNHPAGSDPWCTGISIVSLYSYNNIVSPEILKTGVKWLLKNQLPDGLWPYHYIEDGSIWALYALIKGNYLKND